MERGSSDAHLRLVYAGNPGRKDLLAAVLNALKTINAGNVSVELHVAGPSRDILSACLDRGNTILDELRDVIHFHGRVPQEKIPALLAAADFSILVRPLERYSQAGFSTKLVESFAAGVPVMTNRTGDIDAFVNDGQEGILLRSASSSALVEGLRRALALSSEQKLEMRRFARNRAVQSFDYRNYCKKLDEFLNHS